MPQSCVAFKLNPLQIAIFSEPSNCADVVVMGCMSYSEEAVGSLRACREAGLPAIVSFTVETDGRLPSGEGL